MKCILSFMLILFFILSTTNFTASASDPELIIESELRYSLDTGGGDIIITVQGELAQAIREDIFEEFYLNSSNLNAAITQSIVKEYGEAVEDLLERDINEAKRGFTDMNTSDAGVEFNGNYKIIKIDRVDIKSISGLEGTNRLDSAKFTIKMDIKGPLLKNSEVTLSDGYIILYALWGEQAENMPLVSIEVKEKTTLITIGTNSYSEIDLENGGELKHYRLLMGEYIEYDHDYELKGYNISNGKKDTVRFETFNIVQNSLVLAIMSFLLFIISSVLATFLVKRYRRSKVWHLRILAIILFIALALLYVFGFDGVIIWVSMISFFMVNCILAYGVYAKGWKNLAPISHRHEDFIREPPTIDQGTWHERGVANAKVGNFNEASKCFQNAVDADPKNAVTWNDLGFIHRKLHNYPEAISCFNRALQLRPQYSIALENLQKTAKEINDQNKQ